MSCLLSAFVVGSVSTNVLFIHNYLLKSSEICLYLSVVLPFYIPFYFSVYGKVFSASFAGHMVRNLLCSIWQMESGSPKQFLKTHKWRLHRLGFCRVIDHDNWVFFSWHFICECSCHKLLSRDRHGHMLHLLNRTIRHSDSERSSLAAWPICVFLFRATFS